MSDSGSHWVQADGKEVSFTEVPFRLSKTNATQADKHSQMACACSC
jgi:hypothetical protein